MKRIYLALCLLAVFAMQPADAQKRKKASKKKVVRKTMFLMKDIDLSGHKNHLNQFELLVFLFSITL